MMLMALSDQLAFPAIRVSGVEKVTSLLPVNARPIP